VGVFRRQAELIQPDETPGVSGLLILLTHRVLLRDCWQGSFSAEKLCAYLPLRK